MPVLIDGRDVPSDAPEWRDECRERDLHLWTLKRLRTRQERADYLAALERADGAEAARRVREAFGAWWERARGACGTETVFMRAGVEG